VNWVPPDDFDQIMGGFHRITCNTVKKLEDKFENLKAFAGNVAVFFGESKDMEWEALFKLFLKTFELIQKAKEQNAKLAEQKEKEKRKNKGKKVKRKFKKKAVEKGKGVSGSPKVSNVSVDYKKKRKKGILSASMSMEDVVEFAMVND